MGITPSLRTITTTDVELPGIEPGLLLRTQTAVVDKRSKRGLTCADAVGGRRLELAQLGRKIEWAFILVTALTVIAMAPISERPDSAPVSKRITAHAAPA